MGFLFQSSSDQKAAKQSMTGFNYLTNPNTGIASTVAGGTAANSAEQQLLGLAPESAQTKQGFNNYLNSTGYNFQLQQGQQAITGNAASRGLLNSGATAKALTAYGQNLGSNYFNQYMSQLGGLTSQGLTASGQIGSAGTQGGANAAAATQASGNAMANGIGEIFGL